MCAPLTFRTAPHGRPQHLFVAYLGVSEIHLEKITLGYFRFPCPSFLSLSFTNIPPLAEIEGCSSLSLPTLWTFPILPMNERGCSFNPYSSEGFVYQEEGADMSSVMDTEVMCSPCSPLGPREWLEPPSFSRAVERLGCATQRVRSWS